LLCCVPVARYVLLVVLFTVGSALHWLLVIIIRWLHSNVVYYDTVALPFALACDCLRFPRIRLLLRSVFVCIRAFVRFTRSPFTRLYSSVVCALFAHFTGFPHFALHVCSFSLLRTHVVRAHVYSTFTTWLRCAFLPRLRLRWIRVLVCVVTRLLVTLRLRVVAFTGATFAARLHVPIAFPLYLVFLFCYSLCLHLFCCPTFGLPFTYYAR